MDRPRRRRRTALESRQYRSNRPDCFLGLPFASESKGPHRPAGGGDSCRRQVRRAATFLCKALHPAPDLVRPVVDRQAHLVHREPKPAKRHGVRHPRGERPCAVIRAHRRRKVSQRVMAPGQAGPCHGPLGDLALLDSPLAQLCQRPQTALELAGLRRERERVASEAAEDVLSRRRRRTYHAEALVSGQSFDDAPHLKLLRCLDEDAGILGVFNSAADQLVLHQPHPDRVSPTAGIPESLLDQRKAASDRGARQIDRVGGVH